MMEKKFINSENVDCNGTSFKGDISNVSYRKLVKVFGKETFGMSGDEKSQCEWNIQFEDGTVATIYDWKVNKKYCGKEGLSKSKVTEWHIGGHSSKAVELVKEALNYL